MCAQVYLNIMNIHIEMYLVQLLLLLLLLELKETVGFLTNLKRSIQ